MSGRYRTVLWSSRITVLALSEMYCTFLWQCSWFPPSHVGNGLSHWPSFPHTSSELPFRRFPGTSQLNLRKRSGRMAWLFSGSPLTTTSPSSGGRSHVKAEKTRKWVKGWDSFKQTTQFKTSATAERGAGKTYARTLARDWSICQTYKFWCPLCSPSDICKQKQVKAKKILSTNCAIMVSAGLWLDIVTLVTMATIISSLWRKSTYPSLQKYLMIDPKTNSSPLISW